MASTTFQEIEENIRNDTEITINNITYQGYISDLRVDRITIPNDWHAYDIRHDDEGFGDPAEIKNGYIFVNHYGTFLTKEKLPIEEDESLYFDDVNISIGYLYFI